MNKSPFQKHWDYINKAKIKEVDKYKGGIKFPIGTLRKPIQDYAPGEAIPESDLYFLEMDTIAPNDATSICFIGQAGTLKTTLIKTITYYNSLISGVETRIGILDLKGKSMDWDMCNHPKVNPGMLFPDAPAKMKIVAGCPLFALQNLPTHEKKKIKSMNLNPKELADRDILSAFEFSPTAREILFQIFQSTPPDQIVDAVEKMAKKGRYKDKIRVIGATYSNMIVRLDNMVQTGFLTTKNHFDLNKIWDQGKAFALGFCNKETAYLSVYVDKILTQIFDRANSARYKNERYWVVVDDAYKAFGMNPERYPSVQKGIEVLTSWRSVGINLCVGIQSPSMLNENIYEDIKHFFIYRCGNTQMLSKYIPNRRIIDEIRSLRFYPERHISECIHVHPDKFRYTRFFPFNSPIAN